MLQRILSSKLATIFLSLSLSILLGLNLVSSNDSSVESRFAEYHLRANQILNEHIRSMLYFFDTHPDLVSLDEAAISLITPPQEDQDLSLLCCNLENSSDNPLPENYTCGSENFSEYPQSDESQIDDEQAALEMNITALCLHHKLKQEYNNFTANLSSDELSLDATDTSQSSVLTNASINEEFINTQRESAFILKEQAVKFYSQLYLAYPIHKQYEETLNQLDNFKSNLKNLRQQLLKYPSKFHNATSSSCT